jgi:hypothetical protein
MSSGRIQLAAVGIQDQFLTGNPDVTYFIKKFNRHTKFALEVLNTTFFQTTIDFGSWVNVIIPRNGQLIRTLYVRLVLPPLTVGGYTNSIGNAIIEHADLVIGGQTIERINGEYMQIYDQSFISGSQQDALTYMVGSTDRGLYGLGPAAEFGSGATNLPYGWYPRTFIVPLPFYFFRNEALAIPLCALTRQEVEIRIKFRPLDQLIAGGYTSTTVKTTTSINWTQYSLPTATATMLPLISATWLPQCFFFGCIPQGSTDTIYYYDSSVNLFYSFNNLTSAGLGTISCMSQNNNGVLLILSDRGPLQTSNNVAVSRTGPASLFTGFYQSFINFTNIANDGTDFLMVGQNVFTSMYIAYYLSGTIPEQTTINISNPVVSVMWSPAFNAFVLGDSTGTMYTYQWSTNLLSVIVGKTGPYSAYSPKYGQIYNNSQVVCSNTFISNLYSTSFDGGVTWTQPVPSGSVSIAYGPGNPPFTENRLLTLQATTYNYGYPVDQIVPTIPEVVPGYRFQASLPVEYVFLADEEVQYIQNSKIDYVITQLQLASVVIPAGINELTGYRTYFINPTKEMFITIQDSNVLANNDYYNYFNTSQPTFTNYLNITTGTEQLVNLELQFNGEDIISPTVADNLYLGKVQFLNNHTRLPNLAIYNYSFSIDPENYLPTGQVNMSRIMNQNFWMNFTPNPDSTRNVNIYTKSFNILRVQNGLAGVLFMDNNFIK